jgi:hypothetical protein
MALHTNDDCLSLEADETVTCVAVRLGHLRPVIGWPRLLNRNALTLTEWLRSRSSGEAAYVAARHGESHDA